MKENNMKRNIYRYGMCLFGIIVFIFSGGGCKEDFSGLRFDSNDKMQIYDYVRLREDLSIYKELLDYTGFNGQMSTAGTYTAFVPTNEAFAALFTELNAKGENISNIKDKTPEYWLDYLEYMTCGSKIKSTSMENGILDEPSLMGEKYYVVSDVRLSYNAIKLNSRATIREYDIEVANGYIDIIDKVLLPPTNSIYDMLQESGHFNTMLKVFEKTGFTPYLQDSTITLMVEPDVILQRDKFNPDNLSADELAHWAEYHIILGQKSFDSDLDGKSIYSVYPDESLTFKVDNNGKMWLNNDYPFSETVGQGINNVAANGIYHVLDTTAKIIPTIPGIRDHNLYGGTQYNEDGTIKYEQNVFCVAPAKVYEDTGTSSYHQGQKTPICGVDVFMIGDYFWTTIPDVVKGKWTVRMIYRQSNTADLMMIYKDEIISPELQMNSGASNWPTYTYLKYKDMGVIEVEEREDVKLTFQVIKLNRKPTACCDVMIDIIELRPVTE